MKNKGQVFTTDMIFALILVATLVSVSTQAYGIASGEIRSYSTRHSLERRANDIADVLVKTAGDPFDWEDNLDNLETVGFAKTSGEDNTPVSNYIDIAKVQRLSAAIYGDNWCPEKEPGDESIKEFFGDNNFEIKIKRENHSWSFWPGWEPGESSPRTKSLEVASVKRLVYGKLADVRADTGPVRFDPNAQNVVPPFWGDNHFWVGPGEIEAYDWYIYCENLGPDIFSSQINIAINKSSPKKDVIFKPDDVPGSKPMVEAELIENTTNYIDIHGGDSSMEDNLNFYIVPLLSNQDSESIPEMVKEKPFTLQVMVWR